MRSITRRVISIDQRLGIFYEASLQQLILPRAWIVDFFNYLYIWGHLPVIVAVALWLYIRHPRELRTVPKCVPDIRANRPWIDVGAAAVHA